MKVREITDKISIDRVNHVLHGYLSMGKLSSNWVPLLLILDQKQRFDDSDCCLELFKRDKKGPSNAVCEN